VSFQGPLLSTNLAVGYRNKTGVLKDVSLQIERQEILGLVGQSGSGKSTLALALMALLPLRGGVVTGEVVFRGEDLLRKTERELRAIRGKEMSIVLQSPLTALNPVISVGAQLKECWKAHVRGEAKQGSAAIRSALESVSLPADNDFLARRPSQLSLGQGQRVCIALAILHRPALLLADEATSALDPITQSEILSFFAGLNREMGTAILYISHDLLSVAALCHRICILHEGQIVECGTPDSIFNSPEHEYTHRLVAALPSPLIRKGSNSKDPQDAGSPLLQHSSI
jgi:ABC-type dipeptide/oligopeptide/nickel transport system ATPase component